MSEKKKTQEMKRGNKRIRVHFALLTCITDRETKTKSVEIISFRK